MTTPILSFEHLDLQLGGATVLRDITFHVETGRFVALLGPNGAGKTSLLRCVLRLHRFRGQISLRGQALQDLSHRETARIVSYLSQHESARFPFTVRELCRMSRYPHAAPAWRDRNAADARIDAALATTSVLHLAERTFEGLSGGERRRVSLAAALVQEPSLLLVDEPTTFLDPHQQVEILDLLQRVNRELGITVLAVSHDLNAALRIADQVAFLKDGRLAFHGDPREAIRLQIPQRIYEHEFLEARLPGVEAPYLLARAGWWEPR